MVTRPLEIAGRDDEPVALLPTRLTDLEGRVAGPLLRPGDPGWDNAVLIWNGMVATEPRLVLQPTSAEDVSAAVSFAADHGVLLSVKGGGHNIAGTSLAKHGLTLDMSRMRDVVVDPDARIAHVGGGCLLGDVDRETQRYGLATVLGFISEVGVAGLTLGGGLGYLSRRFGWSVDNLLEVEIVTADGRIQRASRDENADLFWAIRGAGANLGVVTRFTFRLHEVGPIVHGGIVAWPFEQVDEVLETYQTLTAEAPRELTAFLILFRAPPAPFVPEELHGKRVCTMAICYSGDLKKTDAVLAPLAALGEPVFDLRQNQPYAQLQSSLDATEPKGLHYYWRTHYASELSDGLLATAKDLAAENPIPAAEVAFLHLGGALCDHDWDDGAVGNRDARYASGAIGIWEPDDPNEIAYQQWIRNAGERFRPYSTGATYINFQTADEGGEQIRATYGANFERVAAAKQQYDPDNVFRMNRNISRAAADGRS